MSQPSIELVKVTPKTAGDWLNTHWERINKGEFRQRPINMSRVLRYAQAMKDGQWMPSPEPIAFDADFNLIQGQHRLEAVRRSGVTVEFFVSTGWPVGSTIKVLDQGQVRTVSNLLALDGYVGSGKLAAACTAISRIAYRGQAAAVTYANADYMLNKLNLLASIEAIANKMPNRFKDFVGLEVGPLAFYHTVRPGKATSFADGLYNFSAERGSAVYLYLNWTKHRRFETIEPGSPMRSADMRRVGGLCACLRAWDANESPSRVVPNSDAVQWLADLNPKLVEWIRAHVTGAWRNPDRNKVRAKPTPKKVKVTK